MDDFWKTLLWQQFGAAIDMLEDAMRACPDDLWSNRFVPPAPFTLDELDPSGLLPERQYASRSASCSPA